ncbi:DUF808 domain-containing protein [Flavobacteriales bacterium]|nr:DUF808 domain-containing protein [Flavobacteriales bacterium]
MASGFFALLDDIAAIMDDVATLSKVATKKTTGILGDDLAVTAEKASGFSSSRELYVLWAITKGSFINKVIILPIAFLLSAFAPWLITPILLLGGVYLAYEGAEKVIHTFHNKENTVSLKENKALTKDEEVILEKKKIKSAIIVDFILSVEIVIIALSVVIKESLILQVLAVSATAIFATIGVYGLVALLVRIDDLGLALINSANGDKSFRQKIGLLLVKSLPIIIKGLSIIGTIAMLLVAGGIFLHNIHSLHELFKSIPTLLSELFVGTAVGISAYLLVAGFNRIRLIAK